MSELVVIFAVCAAGSFVLVACVGIAAAGEKKTKDRPETLAEIEQRLDELDAERAKTSQRLRQMVARQSLR